MPVGKKAPKGSVAAQTKVVRYVPVSTTKGNVVVPVGKSGKVPVAYLKAVNNARTDKGAKIDNAKTQKGYLKSVTPAQAAKWMSAPNKKDIKNVDTRRMRNKEKGVGVQIASGKWAGYYRYANTPAYFEEISKWDVRAKFTTKDYIYVLF